MKQLKTTPQKARVKGNLVPEYDTLEDIPEYEDYHVSHQLLQKYTYQDVTKNVIRLTPKGDTLYLALTVDNNTINLNATSNITCRCYYKDDMEQEVNLSGHTVYVYDNNSLLTTLVTNSNGLIQVPYSTNIEGKHTLSFKTMYSGGYAPATKNTTITVYRKSILTVSTNSVQIAHDEKKVITWKLTDKDGKALFGKPLTIYEGIRQLETKNTDSKGEVKYTYLESTNRGTETVLTKTGNTILVQNQVNTIEGYLKDINGNPLANQKVHLYVGLSAYSQANATTDANGKFSIQYTPTVYGEYEYYLVYHSNVVNTTNNQYQTYEPTLLSLGNIKPKRSPQLKLTVNVNTTTIGGKIKFTAKVTSDDYNFEGQNVYLQSRIKGSSTFTNIATLKLDTNNTKTYEYTTSNTGEYDFRLYYGGDEEHIANNSSIQSIKVNGKTININTTLPNNSINVTQDYYPITSKVTDSNNNPLPNIVLKYYIDVEGGTNEEGLIGTATTDNNGNATFTGFKGQNTYNTVKATVGTHTIITKHELDNTYEAKKIMNTINVIKRKSQLKITSENSTQLAHNEFVEQPITPLSNWTVYKNKANNYNYVQPSITNEKFNSGKYFFCAYNKNSMSIRSKIHIRFVLNSTSSYNFGFLRDLGVDSDGDKKCGRSVAFNSEGTNTNNVSLPLENNLHIDLILEAGIPYLTINGTSYTYTGPIVDEISLSEQNIWNFYIYSSGNATLEKLEIKEYIPYKLEGTLKYNESINGNLYEVHNHELLVETSGLTQQPLFRHDWFEIPSLNSNINVKKGIHKFELTPFTSANAVSDSTVTEHYIDNNGKLVIGNQKYLYYDFDPSKKFSLYISINLDKHTNGTILIGLQAKNNGKENYYKLIENQTNTRLLYLDNINGTQTTEEQTEINNIQRSDSTKEEYKNNNQLLIQSDLTQITIKYSTASGTIVTYTKPFTYSSGSTMRLYIRSINSSISLNAFNMVEYTGSITDETSNRNVLVDYNVDSPTDIVQLDTGFQTGYRQTTFYKYPIEINDNTDVTFEVTTIENSVSTNYIRLIRLTPEYIFYNQYAYALTKLSERGSRKLRVEFKGLRVIITDLTNNVTVINRTLEGNTNDYKSRIYLGFISVQSGDMLIKRIDRTNHPITQYPILNLENWQFTENLTLDTTSTQSVTPYITNNSYLFPGIRQNCILINRPLDLTKDTYIRIRTYQNSLNLKIGLCAISNGNVTNIFYKTLHDITDNTGWGVHEYVLSINPILNDYDIIIDGITLYNTNNNYTNKNVYLFIYNTELSCYVQDISIRQNEIHLLSDHGEWSTPIVPYGYGTYHFNVSEVETGWYSKVSASKNVIVTEKKVAEITISNKIVKKGTNNTITASVPQDTTGLYLIRVYHSDGNNTVLSSNLEQSNGQISVTSNFSNFDVGFYTYAIEYSGDNKYLDTSSEVKTLHIGDSYKITNNEQVNNTITVQALTSIKLTGTVKTPFGDTYNGTMNCLIDDVLYTQMPVNEGIYNSNNTIINLKQLGLSVGNHSLKLIIQGDNTFETVTLSLTLNVIKNNFNITGQPVAMKKGGSATWSAIVPKDFDGSLYVYSINENGEYITGSAGSSILSSITSNNTSLTISNETTNTKQISWTDRWNTSNTSTVNNVKNEAGEHHIKYRLYNDTYYADVTSNTVLLTRQTAQIQTENVRGFENEDRKINVKCIDTLGNNYNGSLNVYIDGTKTGTINCNNNGEATYNLTKSNRLYNRNTTHTTDIMFEYIFQESGSWSSLNTTANSTSYNIKTGNYGIFVNKTPSMTLANLQSYKTIGITDLYIRKNTESTSTALEDTIQLLEDNNLRQFFRVHAVFNCNRDTIGEGSPWYTDTGKGTGHLLPSRITDLQNHITSLLSKDVDGICFDYIRLASTTTQTHFEEEITNEITQLAQFVKDRTQDKTIIISACTTPEIDISKTNYGQNYQVFEENVDYVLPMIYVYDFSSINETNPLESNGIMWQQTVLNKIYTQSSPMNDGINKKNNKVIPVISTYKGDGHETQHLTTQEYTNQIISMWNYGIERNNTQKSIVFFRHGLTTQNPPRFDYISSATNTAFQIELEPVIKITNINRSTGTLYILWRTKYGGYPSNAGQAYIKIDGTTITKNGGTYYHNINNNGSVAMEVDLTKYTLGTHTVTIVFEGNVEKHIKGGTWNKTITLV